MLSSKFGQFEHPRRLAVWVACLVSLSGLLACGSPEDAANDSDTQTDVTGDVSPDVEDGGDVDLSDDGDHETDESDSDVDQPDDSGDGETTDEGLQPDALPDSGGPDPTVVTAELDRASVQAYMESVSRDADVTTCTPEQPATASSCSENSECEGGSVCRNVRALGLDSSCSCEPAAGCDEIECGTGEVCVPGTSSAQSLCGGGLNTDLCSAGCHAGDCASDSDCGADGRCIVVRDVCGTLMGLACTPTAGSGCLGIDGACGAEEACVPDLTGDWSCISTALACD